MRLFMNLSYMLQSSQVCRRLRRQGVFRGTLEWHGTAWAIFSRSLREICSSGPFLYSLNVQGSHMDASERNQKR